MQTLAGPLCHPLTASRSLVASGAPSLASLQDEPEATAASRFPWLGSHSASIVSALDPDEDEDEEDEDDDDFWEDDDEEFFDDDEEEDDDEED